MSITPDATVGPFSDPAHAIENREVILGGVFNTTTIKTIAMQPWDTIMVTVTVVFTQGGTGPGRAGIRSSAVFSADGTPTVSQIGSTIAEFNQQSPSYNGINFTTSGGNVNVNVTNSYISSGSFFTAEVKWIVTSGR